MAKRQGASYRKRVADINRIYDRYARSGLSNREIWRRHIYPVWCISERTFYNIMNAAAVPGNIIVMPEIPGLFDQPDDKQNISTGG